MQKEAGPGSVRIQLEQSSILTDLEDQFQRTAISWAAIRGRLEVLQLLLSREDAIAALETAGSSEESPLDRFLIKNDVPVQELLSYRAKVEASLNE